MTDLYTPEGVLDYAAAAGELAAAPRLTNEPRQAATVARVKAAATLDIAVSLNAIVGLLAGQRVGADEAVGREVNDEDVATFKAAWAEADAAGLEGQRTAHALAAVFARVDAEREVGPDGEPMGDPERGEDDDERPLEAGDWAAPREVGGPEDAEPAQILAVDVREGEPVVNFGNGWLFASAFYRVDIDSEGYDLDTPDAETEPAEDDDPPTGRDMVDDIDADFGPAEPVAEAPRCETPHPTIEGVTCARKASHDGKHRKGNLKWA